MFFRDATGTCVLVIPPVANVVLRRSSSPCEEQVPALDSSSSVAHAPDRAPHANIIISDNCDTTRNACNHPTDCTIEQRQEGSPGANKCSCVLSQLIRKRKPAHVQRTDSLLQLKQPGWVSAWIVATWSGSLGVVRPAQTGRLSLTGRAASKQSISLVSTRLQPAGRRKFALGLFADCCSLFVCSGSHFEIARVLSARSSSDQPTALYHLLDHHSFVYKLICLVPFAHVHACGRSDK